MTSHWAVRSESPAHIDDNHRPWIVPGIMCRTCEHSWATFGAALPSVTLEGRAAELTRVARAVYVDEWRDIAREVRPCVPASEPILPGLQLGPLSGRVLKPFRLGWYHAWALFAEEALKEEIQTLAPEIPLVLSNLTDGQGGRYYELEIRCGGEVLTTTKERCGVCGYLAVAFPMGPYALSKVPEQSLFRDPFLTTQIFAHERLLPFLKRELGPAADFIPAPLAS